MEPDGQTNMSNMQHDCNN